MGNSLLLLLSLAPYFRPRTDELPGDQRGCGLLEGTQCIRVVLYVVSSPIHVA